MARNEEEKRYQQCFVCGQENEKGLKLKFYYPDEDSAEAKISISKDYEGYPGVVHGGILSTLLDEVMAKAILNKGIFAFTARLNVRYRQPLAPQREVKVKGTIESQKASYFNTKAMIYDDERVYAEAEALFLVPKKPQ